VNARALDGWRQLRKRFSCERHARREGQRTFDVIGSDESQRNSRCVTLFAAQARPERRVDDCLDGGLVGQRRHAGLSVLARQGQLL
jgi:hypothetical protein